MLGRTPRMQVLRLCTATPTHQSVPVPMILGKVNRVKLCLLTRREFLRFSGMAGLRCTCQQVGIRMVRSARARLAARQSAASVLRWALLSIRRR